jgi:hypothetical protein
MRIDSPPGNYSTTLFVFAAWPRQRCKGQPETHETEIDAVKRTREKEILFDNSAPVEPSVFDLKHIVFRNKIVE